MTLVLENVRSGRNVGSILRTADAFGLREVILVGYTPQPPHREILKTSLGAEESVPWRHFGTIEETVEALRQNGGRILALEQTTESILVGVQVFAQAPTSRSPSAQSLLRAPSSRVKPNDLSTAIVLRQRSPRRHASRARPRRTALSSIPQYGMKHSLNVSVAAGIVAYVAAMAYRRIIGVGRWRHVLA